MGFSGSLFGRRQKAQEPISAGSLSPKLRGYGVILGAGIKGRVVKICRRGKKNVFIKFLCPRTSEQGGSYTSDPFTMGIAGI